MTDSLNTRIIFHMRGVCYFLRFLAFSNLVSGFKVVIRMGCSSVMYARLLLCVCLLSAIFAYSELANETTTATWSAGSVFINGSVAIGRIDTDFICATLDWWPPEKCDYGRCSWDHASLLDMDLNNVILLKAVKAFNPLKIRLGGNLQDKLIYQTEDHQQPCNSFSASPSEMFGFTQGCLPLYRWDQLNAFFQKSGAEVIFGLNALYGKTMSAGVAYGAWNSSNAEALIRYTAKKGYNIFGWELGNELCGGGIGVKIPADEYASDAIALRNKVQEIYKNSRKKPKVVAPGGFFDADWFTTFLKNSNKAVDAVSHHIYNMGPGVDEHLIDKILNPAYLDGSIGDTYRSLQEIIKKAANSGPAWVGEAGGAYNSGQDGVTNAFVYSFWYLDQLGMSATFDTRTYCRQSLIGGNYGLLSRKTFVPNPDYYSALLWHKLMGTNVLDTKFAGSKKVRAYAHCAKQSKGVVLLLLNLDGSNTFQVSYTADGVRRSRKKQRRDFLKLKFHDDDKNMPGQIEAGSVTREEYRLTAKNGDLHSRVMVLNGKDVGVDKDGNIPQLNPQYINGSEAIVLYPHSIVFAHIPRILLPACR